MLSREITLLSVETVTVEDSGFKYEVDFRTKRNSDYNISNGAKEITHDAVAFRLKADGSRGLQLKGLNKRIGEIAHAARKNT